MPVIAPRKNAGVPSAPPPEEQTKSGGGISLALALVAWGVVFGAPHLIGLGRGIDSDILVSTICLMLGLALSAAAWPRKIKGTCAFLARTSVMLMLFMVLIVFLLPFLTKTFTSVRSTTAGVLGTPTTSQMTLGRKVPGDCEVTIQLRSPFPDQVPLPDIRILYVKNGTRAAESLAELLSKKGEDQGVWKEIGRTIEEDGKPIGFVWQFSHNGIMLDASRRQVRLHLNTDTLPIPIWSELLQEGKGQLLASFVESAPGTSVGFDDVWSAKAD